MKAIAQSGAIVRPHWPARAADQLNLYLGSGRAGACFDAWGLMHHGWRGERGGQGRTHLLHADHWHRGAHGLDYWLPVARLVWADRPPARPRAWRQELDPWNGRLVTELVWPGVEVRLTAWFNPAQRDLLAVAVDFDAVDGLSLPALLLAPEVDVQTHYDQILSGDCHSVEARPEDGWWLGRLRVGTADSVLGLRVVSSLGGVELSAVPDGQRIDFEGSRGRHLILIGTAGWARREELSAALAAVGSPEQERAAGAEAWHRRWGDGWISLPVPEYQALWARSLFWTLCSYGPDVAAPAAPMGWSGDGWPFGFPQDLSYLHPALLRLGHHDIAKAWVEFYRDRLEMTVDITKRVYGLDGAMWAWEHPIGRDSKMLEGGAPNPYQFEIHNAAYPARMAREAARHLGDPAWAREVAWPVVRESARFFGSALTAEADGVYSLQVTPSMGQDEMGGENARNYLCALFSAQYALGQAVAMAGELGLAEPQLERWRAILKAGLAFDRLLDPAVGLRVTCEGVDGRRQIGREKHPVQLNPLTFLPLGPIDAVTRAAYHRRYELCAGVREDFFHGWTLAAYWLAASHMGDAEGLLHDLGRAVPGRYVDPDWIQIYETSGSYGMTFYVTSHGLGLQALNDALVSDYFGEVQIGAACPASWGEVSFGGLRTADRRVWSGQKQDDGGWQVSS
jgi:hypothetical protein